MVILERGKKAGNKGMNEYRKVHFAFSAAHWQQKKKKTELRKWIRRECGRDTLCIRNENVYPHTE